MTGWQRPTLPPRLLSSRQVPLVGRGSELQAFEEMWAAVEEGNRQVVLVGGEPGAGKTRLAAEVAIVLAEHDVPVLVGTSSTDAGIPYEPFATIVDTLLEVAPPDLASRLGDEVLQELSRLSPRLADRNTQSPDWRAAADRRGLFDAVARLVRTLADAGPAALILDDLHWAQLPTLALMEHIVQECADCPLLVMATFRTTAPDQQLAARLAELHRLEGVRRLDLGGLDTEAIAEYLSRQAGIPRRAALEPAAILRERTGGNAFFLRELWSDLEQRGGLADIRSQRVPASIGDTLEGRLMSLDSEVREVIELAAVLGGVFHLPVLLGANQAGREHTMDAIDTAVSVGLIEPAEEGADGFSFVHSLTRQAVLDRMSSSRVTLLNAQVAETLEAQGDTPSLLPRLAHHYMACHVLGYEQKAYHYSTEAARQAERSFAFEEAAMWFERAASLHQLSPGQRAECLFGAAANHLRAGDFARAREIYDPLAAFPDPLVRLQAAMGYEDANWRPGLGDSRPADLLTSAIAACQLGSDDPLYIRALGSLGRALAFAGETRRAREVGRQAIELARAQGDRTVLAHALKVSLWHGLTPDVAEVQLQRSTELSHIAKEMGDFEILGQASYFRAMVAYLSGRPGDLDEAVKDSRQAVDSTAQPFFMYVAGCVAQGLAFMRGDFEEAERWAQSTLRVGDSFGADTTEGSHGVQMFMLHRETGRIARFGRYLTGEERFTGRWVPGLLALYAELGNEKGMRRALDLLLGRNLSSHTTEASWPMDLAFMIEGACRLGDARAAELLLPLAEAYAGSNLVAGQFVALFGSADRLLARLEAVLGDDAAARRHYESAQEMDRLMGSTVHRAETLAHHALFCKGRGEMDQAQALARQARDLAGPIGQSRVLALLEGVGGNGRVDRLSGREVEVLRLLALGLSNREIGERLYISGNTAANHVRKILIKTGAANRTQAAMYAAEHDLV